MEKIRVLFVCVHNSARSQMAEAYLKNIGGDKFEAESAGLEAGELNPFAIEAMKEIGIDISDKKTNSVFEYYKQGRLYNYVITVCDKETQERCPIFPGLITRLDWSFADPSTFTGAPEEKLAKTRKVRNEIEKEIMKFIKSVG